MHNALQPAGEGESDLGGFKANKHELLLNKSRRCKVRPGPTQNESEIKEENTKY